VSAELLAKMTAKGILIDGGGFGGEVQISPADVAGALSGISGPAYDYVLLKYCDDRSVSRRLLSAFAEKILESEKRQPGKFSAREAVRFASVIITNAIGDGNCKTCKGTGIYRYKKCAGCDGAGKRPKSNRAIAEALGLTPHQFKTTGERIYREYGGLLCEWEGWAFSRINKQLSDVNA
jgi:hypothetical protein